MSKQSDTMLNKPENEDPLKIMKVLSNEIRASIFLYIVIFHELTLERLSELLSKSKSTIHHHIQQLMAIGIVEEGTKAGKKTKYYRVNEEKAGRGLYYSEDIDDQYIPPPEEFSSFFSGLIRTATFFTQKSISLAVDYLEKKIAKSGSFDMFREFMDELSFDFRIQLFTEERYRLFEKELEEFDQKLEKLFDEMDTEDEKERPYILYRIILPLKEILDTKYTNK